MTGLYMPAPKKLSPSITLAVQLAALVLIATALTFWSAMAMAAV